MKDDIRSDAERLSIDQLREEIAFDRESLSIRKSGLLKCIGIHLVNKDTTTDLFNAVLIFSVLNIIPTPATIWLQGMILTFAIPAIIGHRLFQTCMFYKNNRPKKLQQRIEVFENTLQRKLACYQQKYMSPACRSTPAHIQGTYRQNAANLSHTTTKPPVQAQKSYIR